MKKLLTVLLTVLMALTIGTVNVLAEDDTTPTISVKIGDTTTAYEDFELESDKEHYDATFKYDGTALTEKSELVTIAKNIVDNGDVDPACGKTPHTHDGDCYKSDTPLCNEIEHTHVLGCLGDDYSATNSGGYKNAKVVGGTTYYVKNNFAWKCGYTDDTYLHTHTEDCYGSETPLCGEEEHTHFYSCYEVEIPLTVDYEAIEYTVTFDANGGSFDGEETLVVTTSADEDFLVTPPTEPTRTNYEFGGYYIVTGTDAGDEEITEDIDDVVTYEFKKDTTVYASWYAKEVNVELLNAEYEYTTADKAILAKLAKGKNKTSELRFNLNKDDDTDLEEIAAIETLFADGEEVAIDVNLTLDKEFYMINKGGEKLKKTEPVTDMGEGNYVTVEIELPTNEELPLKDGYRRTYRVYYYHDGAAHMIPNSSVANGTITFNTNKFSTYVVSYVDTKIPTPSPKPIYVAPITGIEG